MAASRSLAPDRFERLLAIGAIVLLAAVAVALARGQAEWGRVSPAIWAHLATVGLALALTPWLLLRARGTASHRALGWVWAVAMFATAAISFAIHESNPGGYSLIHVLSGFTVVAAPLVVLAARRHRVAQHRRSVRALVLGALLIAGFFTFPFNRLLGHWLFG